MERKTLDVFDFSLQNFLDFGCHLEVELGWGHNSELVDCCCDGRKLLQIKLMARRVDRGDAWWMVYSTSIEIQK
jgi:hypothetical protein